MKKHEKKMLGRIDSADFPFFGLKNVPVKIDSGAYTSSIDCELIELKNDKLEVIFLNKKSSIYTGERIIFDSFKEKKIRSSSGQAQFRYTIKGIIILFGVQYQTEFTLSKRRKMKFPVLLGRKILNKNFVIDTSLSNLSFKNKIIQNENSRIK